MQLTAGPVIIVDTKPKRFKTEPRVPGNQAVGLFVPVFVAFLLVLLSNLTTPIIGGLSVLDINTHENGTVHLGAWGWCASGVPNVTKQCSPHRAFGSNMQPELTKLPDSLQPLADISTHLPGSYVVASAVFHMFAALAAWMTCTWTLAASGAWANMEVQAHDWTRWAFAGTFWSSLFILISWALDLGSITRVHHMSFPGLSAKPKVTPGPAIWLMMFAFLLSLGSFILRVSYLKFKPRPLWTIKGANTDFHNNFLQPMPEGLETTEAAIGHGDEKVIPEGYVM